MQASTQSEMTLTSLQSMIDSLILNQEVGIESSEKIGTSVSRNHEVFIEKYEKFENNKNTLFKSLISGVSITSDLCLEYFSSIQKFNLDYFKKSNGVIIPSWMEKNNFINKMNETFVTIRETRDLFYELLDMFGIDKKIENDKMSLEKSSYSILSIVEEFKNKFFEYSDNLIERIDKILDVTGEGLMSKKGSGGFLDKIFNFFEKRQQNNQANPIVSPQQNTEPPKKNSENNGGMFSGVGNLLSGFGLAKLFEGIKIPNLPKIPDLLKFVGSVIILKRLFSPSFSRMFSNLSDNITKLFESINEERVEKISSSIEKLGDSFSELNKTVKPLAGGIALLSLSFLTLSLITITPNFLLSMGVMTLFVGIMTRISKDNVSSNMQQFGIGIAAMTAGLVLLNFVAWESVLKLTSFVFLLGIALRTFSDRNEYPNMIKFGTSIAIMTLSLVAMNVVTWNSVFMMPFFLSLLGLSLNTFDKDGKDLLRVSYGLGIITLSLVALHSVNWKAPLMLLGFTGSLLVMMWMFNREGLGKRSPMISFATGIGIITLSLFALQELDWRVLAVSLVWMTGVALVTRIGAGNRTSGMIGFATGIGILTLALYAMQEIEWNGVFKMIVFVGGLGIAMRLLPKTAIPSMISLAASIGIMSASLFLFKKSNFGWEDLGLFAATIGGIVALYALVGIPVVAGLVALGSGVMILASASLLTVALSLLAINKTNVDPVKIDEFSQAVKSLAMTLALITPFALIGLPGSVLMIPLAASSLLTATSLFAISKLETSKEQIDNFGYSIKTLSLAYALSLPQIILGVVASALFLPIAGVSLLTAGVLHLISKTSVRQESIDAFNTGLTSIVNTIDSFGIIKLGKVMLKAEALLPLMKISLMMSQTMKNLSDSKVSPEDMKSFTSVIESYVDNMSRVINDSVSKIKSCEKGIEAIAGLTNISLSLAETIHKMSNMEIVEHEVKDGQLVVKNVKKFDWENDMKKISPNIGMMIFALVDPLLKLAAMKDKVVIGNVTIKNPFSKKNMKGIEFVKKVGEAYVPIVESVNTIANLDISKDTTKLETFKTSSREIVDTVLEMYSKLLEVKPNDNSKIVSNSIKELTSSFSGSSDIKEFNDNFIKTIDVLSSTKTWNNISSNIDKVTVKADKLLKTINLLNLDKFGAFERTLKMLLEKSNNDKIVELLEKLIQVLSLSNENFKSNNVQENVVITQPNNNVVQSNPQPNNQKLDSLIQIVNSGLNSILEEIGTTNTRLMGTLKVRDIDKNERI